MDEYSKIQPKSSVQDWIDGKKAPTIKQLEKFAKTVNLPFGFLFLKDLPSEELPIPMFRRTSETRKFNLNVYDTVLSIIQKQNWLEDYLKENEIPACHFIKTISINATVSDTVAKLREWLNLDERWAFSLSDYNAAINRITERLEDAGVFLVFNSVVGNNTHRKITVDDCRGFAIANDYAPYIFVNNSDSKSAQMFTLIHETCHLALGESAGYAGEIGYEHNATETFCDKVAADFLVPIHILREMWDSVPIDKLAKKFKVSELVIARRAHDCGLLDDLQYREFYKRYSARIINVKKTQHGSFYLTSVKRIGKLFAIHIRNAVNSRQLSYTDAYRLTGLYGDTYNKFMTNNI